jgi:RHS repeat-associated protein
MTKISIGANMLLLASRQGPAGRIARIPRASSRRSRSRSACPPFYYGFREYAPQLGRWLSRDPIGERGGANLFAFVSNDPQSKVDSDGRLTITLKYFSKDHTTCGERGVSWIFRLDKSAPCDGYLVQQVEKHEVEHTCDKSQIIATPIKLTSVWWEAWPVSKGETVSDDTIKEGSTDMSNRLPSYDTCGSAVSHGTVKFYCKYTTGDLGGIQRPPTDPPEPKWLLDLGLGWGPYQAALSGGLPGTLVKPIWWDSPSVEGPAYRWASSYWNCCGGKRESIVEIYPK